MQTHIKRARNFNTELKPSKRKNIISETEKFGIFVAGIPKSYKINQIEKLFNGNDFFIPRYKNIHMEVFYISFLSEEERRKKYLILTKKFEKYGNLSYSLFSGSSGDTLEDTAKIFVDISKSFYNKTNNNNKTLVQDVDQKIALSKEKAIRVLSNNYYQIKISLETLRLKRGSSTGLENNIENSQWFIFYHIFWFILTKLSVSNFSDCEFLFKYFAVDESITFFKLLDSIHPVIRLYVCEIFFQLTYLENQFPKNNSSMILSVKNLVIDDQSITQLSEFSREKMEQFKEILKQDMIKTKFKFANKPSYELFINEALSNVYLATLPDFLHGITLFNRFILVNFRESRSRYDENSFYWGYTFFVILHELAHYCKRYKYSIDIEWLEFSTPEKFNLRDAGSILEFQLFGKVLECFSTRTADFALNPQNWKLPSHIFQKKFNKANKWENSGANRGNIQMRWLRSGKIDFIQLGLCCKEMARRSKSMRPSCY
jgi:hypothetical protein